MAKLDWEMTANNKDFLAKVKQMERSVSDATNKIESEGASLDGVFKKIAASAAAVGAGFSVQKLVSDIVRVRGEFQQLEIAMETMLGSQEKATALMSQLTQTAAKTPFGLTDIAQGAKQLLAYGTASEEVNETLVRLGNIASGLSIPLNDLVYLYGTTMTQGRLFTQDLRQFMGRGIPLADELAKQFGVTKDKVGELVTEGKVGFPEVEKAIHAMTNEGGKFFNLMEKQSSSLTGQISNLEDAWDMMLNEIGTKTQGVASAAIQGVSSLIENYERVGKIVMDIALIYGTYKAAVAAVSVVHKINSAVLAEAIAVTKATAASNVALTRATTLAIARTNLLTAAKQKLIATMKGMGKALTNPYTIAAAAVTALAFGIYKLITYQTEAEKAQKRLNDAFTEASASAGSEIKKLDELKGRLSAAKKGSAEYYEIKDEIVKNFGKYDSTLADEIERVGDLSTKYDVLAKAIQDSANARMYDKYVEDETARYDKDVTGKLKKLQETIYGAKGISTEDAARTYSKIWKNIFQGEALDQETENVIKSFDKVLKGTDNTGKKFTAIQNPIRDYIADLNDLNVQQDEFINNARTMFGFGADTSDFNKGLKNLTEEQLNQTKKDLAEVLSKFKETKQEQDYSLVSGEDITFATEQQITDAIANVDSFLAQIKANRDKNKPKEEEYEESAIKKAEQTAEKVAEASRKAEYGLKKAQTKDEIELIKLERDQKIEALNDELEAYKAIYEAAGKDTKELEESFARMIDVERQMADIEINEANKDKSDKIKDELDELLKEFETYQQAVTRIEKEYDEKRKKMYEEDGKTFKAGFDDDNVRELERQKKEAIEEVADNYADKSDAFESWAESLASIAITELNKMLALAKARLSILKNTEGVDELEIAQAEAAIESLETAISNSNDTTKESKANWTELSKVINDAGSVFGELGDIIPGVAGEVLAGVGGIASASVEMANGIKAIEKNASAAEKASAVLAVISAAIKVVQFFTNAAEENKQAYLASAKAADEYRRAIEDLTDQKLKEKYDTAFGNDALGEFIEKSEGAKKKLDELKESLGSMSTFDYTDYYMDMFSDRSWASLSKKVRDKLDEIMAQGDTALVSDMRSTWQKYWGSGVENIHVANLSDFIDESGALDTEALNAWIEAYGEGLSDETRQAIESMIADWEAYGETVAEINDYVKSLFGTMSSTVADSMIDSWIETGNAIANAKDVLGDYAKAMAKAVIESKLLESIFTDEAAQQMADLVAVGDTEGALSILAGLLEQANELAPHINDYLAGVDEVTGGALSGDDEGGPDREPSKKGIATASQESVDENNARLTAIQGHTYSINEECKKNAANSAQIISRLTAIERNTAYLSTISTNIAAISSDIEVIKNRGVTML
ncbi:MAG: tape measure protein [Bacteroidales bacterium]|nr:tape measure protein [Bacteroidales bacterium]